MSYSLLLGVIVALSVMFFWLGRRFARPNVGVDDQLGHYLEDAPDSLLRDTPIDTQSAPGFIERVIAPLMRGGLNRLGSLAPNRNVDAITHRLDTAGRPYSLSVLNFLGLKFITALIFAVIGFLLFVGLLHRSISTGVVFFIIFAIIGFYIPNFWLSAAIRTRQRIILRTLPDALDMIVVCTDAGQSFDQALRQVGTHWHNALTEEFNRILAEIMFGRTRREALVSAADRIQLAEMSNLLTAIIQAEELGVAIGKVLRIQAEQLRLIRRQRAEELAHQAATKLLFPLVFLIFPAMFAVLLGPAIPLIIETFGTLGG